MRLPARGTKRTANPLSKGRDALLSNPQVTAGSAKDLVSWITAVLCSLSSSSIVEPEHAVPTFLGSFRLGRSGRSEVEVT